LSCLHLSVTHAHGRKKTASMTAADGEVQPARMATKDSRLGLPELSTLTAADEDRVDATKQNHVSANTKPDGPRQSDPFQFGSR